jgi:Ni,Fe-hydrogenase III small subunit
VRRSARRRLGRSLAIRQVDAGSCNACELEIQALNNAFYDLERFGFRFVASPRHADVLLVTGPVTKKHARGARTDLSCDTRSKMVVAVGDCTFDAGIFAGSYAVAGGVSSVIPVDLCRLPAIADAIVARSAGNHGARHRQKYRLVVIRGARSIANVRLPTVGATDA